MSLVRLWPSSELGGSAGSVGGAGRPSALGVHTGRWPAFLRLRGGGRTIHPPAAACEAAPTRRMPPVRFPLPPAAAVVQAWVQVTLLFRTCAGIHASLRPDLRWRGRSRCSGPFGGHGRLRARRGSLFTCPEMLVLGPAHRSWCTVHDARRTPPQVVRCLGLPAGAACPCVLLLAHSLPRRRRRARAAAEAAALGAACSRVGCMSATSARGRASCRKRGGGGTGAAAAAAAGGGSGGSAAADAAADRPGADKGAGEGFELGRGRSRAAGRNGPARRCPPDPAGRGPHRTGQVQRHLAGPGRPPPHGNLHCPPPLPPACAPPHWL